MHSLFAVIIAAEATTNPAETWYSPGVIGFIATFGVTAAAVALIFDMVRRVRRVRYRAEIQQKLDVEQAASEAAPTAKPKPAAAKATAAKTPTAKTPLTKTPATKAPTARVKPARPEPPKKPTRD